METIPQALNLIKPVNLFRDILVLIGGFVSFLILQYFLDYNLYLEINNFFETEQIEKLFIVITFSYIVGRLLLIIADIYLIIYNYLLKIIIDC